MPLQIVNITHPQLVPPDILFGTLRKVKLAVETLLEPLETTDPCQY
jgi:hypothetical protein